MDPNYQQPTNYQAPEPTPISDEPKKSKFRLRKFKPSRKHSGFLMFVIVVAAIGIGAYVYRNNAVKPAPGNTLGAQTEEEQQEQNEEILNKVQQLTVVPMDEEPEIAVIADTTKLDDQAFFSRAQNGDRVIIYRTAKRVVLYRPSTNMIVETGPLVEPTSAPESRAAPEAPAEQ